jgi:hypothetical protein
MNEINCTLVEQSPARPIYTSATIAGIIARDTAEREDRVEAVGYKVHETGTSPQKRYTVEFVYSDGTTKTFDGRNWK